MQQEIESIKIRNKRVEADKAWETSKVRRGLITLFTYFIVVLFLYLIKVPKPWLNAVVPAMGFLLSTLTLKIVKEWWIAKIYKK